MKSSNILSNTNSVCPHCLDRIPAKYEEIDNEVFLTKSCPLHGSFSTLISESVAFFKSWVGPLANHKTADGKAPSEKGCPYSCGICTEHKQTTCCVLLEVTERCNMNCPICFANAGDSVKQDPSIEKISSWYDMLMEQGGPFNIQLSGGEPTMRDDLGQIIRIGKEKGFTFFQINTNGIRIGEDKSYLLNLKENGLTTVFLQFDGFLDSTNLALRGKNLLSIKKRAIQHCKELNLGVVLVPTIKKGVNDTEIGDILKFAFLQMPTVRGVHFQPMSFFGRYDSSPQNENRMTLFAMLKGIEEQTQQEMKESHFSHGGAEHPQCSFSGDFTYTKAGEVHPIPKGKGTCHCSSKQAREVVSRKWTVPEKTTTTDIAGLSLQSLDEFIAIRQQQTLAVSCMAFQDAWTLDLERLQRCYIHEVSTNGNLIPFCAYNLTNCKGVSLYR